MSKNSEEIIRHIGRRFHDLHLMLRYNTGLRVVIAGYNGEKNAKTNIDVPRGRHGVHGHTLGVGLAKGQWGDDGEGWRHTVEALDAGVTVLIEMYGDRVIIDNVGFGKQDPFAVKDNNNLGEKCIHVWGANAGNWNLKIGEEVTGGGQAAAMGKAPNGQQVGMFGIVTTPVGGIDGLEDLDKTHQSLMKKDLSEKKNQGSGSSAKTTFRSRGGGYSGGGRESKSQQGHLSLLEGRKPSVGCLYSNQDVRILRDALLIEKGYYIQPAGDEATRKSGKVNNLLCNIADGGKINQASSSEGFNTFMFPPISIVGNVQAGSGLQDNIRRALNSGAQKIQILFPIRKSYAHWVVGQILIDNKKKIAEFRGFDPFGNGSPGDLLVGAAREVLTNAGIKFKYCPSKIVGVQGSITGDGVYCGGYTAHLVASLSNHPFLFRHGVKFRGDKRQNAAKQVWGVNEINNIRQRESDKKLVITYGNEVSAAEQFLAPDMSRVVISSNVNSAEDRRLINTVLLRSRIEGELAGKNFIELTTILKAFNQKYQYQSGSQNVNAKFNFFDGNAVGKAFGLATVLKQLDFKDSVLNSIVANNINLSNPRLNDASGIDMNGFIQLIQDYYNLVLDSIVDHIKTDLENYAGDLLNDKKLPDNFLREANKIAEGVRRSLRNTQDGHVIDHNLKIDSLKSQLASFILSQDSDNKDPSKPLSMGVGSSIGTTGGNLGLTPTLNTTGIQGGGYNPSLSTGTTGGSVSPQRPIYSPPAPSPAKPTLSSQALVKKKRLFNDFNKNAQEVESKSFINDVDTKEEVDQSFLEYQRVVEQVNDKLNPADFLKPETYSGIGAKASYDYDSDNKCWLFTITEVIPGGPASKMGLGNNEEIMIGGGDTPESLKEAVEYIRGWGVKKDNSIVLVDNKNTKRPNTAVFHRNEENKYELYDFNKDPVDLVKPSQVIGQSNTHG